MKRIYLPLLILLFLFLPCAQADPIDSIAWLLRQGNTQRLSQLLAPDVELTIGNEESSYSKIQASAIITQFFNQHKPVRVSLLHKVNSGRRFLFGVVIFNSTNGVYRIAYTIDETKGSVKIIELRIEPEKTK